VGAAGIMDRRGVPGVTGILLAPYPLAKTFQFAELYGIFYR
jgi:hypothetical protein